MKKIMKKTLAVMLAVVMVLSLTACAKKEEPAKKDDAPVTTQAPEQTTTNSEVKTEEAKKEAEVTPEPATEPELSACDKYFADYPAFDMGGRTIKIGMFYDAYYDSNDTVPEDNPGVNNLPRAQAKLDNLRRLEKKYNVRIEYINPGSDALIDSLNTSVVAGTPDYDVYLTQLDFALPLAVNGYFTDLASLKKDYSKKGEVLTDYEFVGKDCFFYPTGVCLDGTFLAYNADILAEKGLEDPNELYARGEWTWEKFEEYAVALTSDVDNDGVIDVYGFGGDLTYILTEFLASNNAILIGPDGQQQIDSPESLATFEFLNKLFNEDFAARPVTDDWGDNIYAWINGKTVFGPTAMWILQTTEIDFNYRIVPWPAGPSSQGKCGQSFGDYYVIPKGVKDADKVYQIMEEFFGWFGGDFESRDSSNIQLAEECFLEESDVQTSFDIGMNGNGDIWSMIDTDYLMTSVFGQVVTLQMRTPAQAAEAHKQLFQDEIDAILK